MSAIYGYINLDGKPVEPETLQSMREAMAFCGKDGKFEWLEGNCCLGQELLFNTPEAVNEKYPLVDASGNIVFIAACRIDNRAELFTLLDTPNDLKYSITDGELMFQSYLKWGDNACDKMLGDWSFAAWHKKEQKLFIGRDHHGITAMYYYKGPNFFVFSSSLKGILCLKQVPIKINEYYIAQILVGWNEGGPECTYIDILRLTPSHTLTLNQNQVKTNRYWFLENTPELHLPKPQDYIDQFMEIYNEAVRCRLRSYRPVGATLSGGLDSGSVCALAAKQLEKEGKRLTTFTAVPLYDTTGLIKPGRIGDEGPLAKEVADFVGNIDPVFCNAESISPLDGIRKMIEIHDQPYHSVTNSYWIIDILEQIKKQKFGTLIIAQNGNSSVSFPNQTYLDQIRTQYYPHKLILFWLRLFYLKIFRDHYWQYYNRFNSNYFKSLNINSTDIITNSRTTLMKNKTLHKIQKFSIQPGKIGAAFSWFENGLYYGIEARDPTIDKIVLTFCYSIPQPVYLRLGERFLIKKGFINLLPINAIHLNSQNIQSADLVTRLKNTKETNFVNPFDKNEINTSRFFAIPEGSINRNVDVKDKFLKPFMIKTFYGQTRRA